MDESAHPARVAVLASGAGTTFASLADTLDRSVARVVLLIVSRAEAGAHELAEAREIECVVLDQRQLGVDRCDTQMAALLTDRGIELVVLAGYLRKIGAQTLSQFAGPILNTHPAPLPRFGGKGMYGDHVYRAVLDSGVGSSAATVHLVDGDYDTGQALAEQPVPVLADDDVATLRARVQQAERELLTKTIQSVLKR